MLSTVGCVKCWRESAAVVELVTHFVCYDLRVFFVLGDPVSLSLQALSNSITSCFSLRLPTITKCLRLDAWLLFMTQVRSSIFDILLVCGKERFLFRKPVELTTGDFNQYDSDLPLRAFTQLLKLFMREARILKQVEQNIHLKRSAVPNSIQFDFNIWPWLSASYRSFFHRPLPYWWLSGDRCVLDIISTCLLMRTYGFFFYLLFSLPKLK